MLYRVDGVVMFMNIETGIIVLRCLTKAYVDESMVVVVTDLGTLVVDV